MKTKKVRRKTLTRLRGLLLAVSLVLGGLTGVVATAGSASASTTQCSGFTACTTAPYTDHGYSSHTTTSYWGQTASTGHNCTNYVAYYEETVNGMAATRPSWLSTQYNADGWATEASGAGITVSSTPAVGAVAQWGDYGWNGAAGHVAIVESVSSDGKTIEISEDSYPSGPYEWVQFKSTDANTSATQGWPDNFIYLGGVTATPPPPKDSDGDGIPDSIDACPLQPGPASTNGCPDTDGDGIADKDDVCVDEPGVSYLSGCPQQQAKLNGDFNGDGKQDVAAFYRYPERGNALALYVWLGNGDGTFGSAQLAWYTSSGWDGTRVIVAGAGDFNHDGITDIAAFYRYDNTTVRLFTWMGQANGTFTDPIVGPVQSGFEGANLIPVGVGDFNGDGKLDVVAFYRYPERGNALALFTFPGNGDGTTGYAQLDWYNSTGWDGLHVIPAGTGDFNHDGKPDIVAFYEYPGTSVKMFEWFGTSSGTFADPTVEFSGSGWEGFHLIPIGVGDFNGDGILDVAVFYRYPERGNAVGLYIWYGNGDGTFGTPQLPWYTASGWDGTHVISAGVGDYDHNGQSDITTFYEYPDTSVKMFEWHNEHWGYFPTTDPSIQFSGTGWEGFHILA